MNVTVMTCIFLLKHLFFCPTANLQLQEALSLRRSSWKMISRDLEHKKESVL